MSCTTTSGLPMLGCCGPSVPAYTWRYHVIGSVAKSPGQYTSQEALEVYQWIAMIMAARQYAESYFVVGENSAVGYQVVPQAFFGALPQNPELFLRSATPCGGNQHDAFIRFQCDPQGSGQAIAFSANKCKTFCPSLHTFCRQELVRQGIDVTAGAFEKCVNPNAGAVTVLQNVSIGPVTEFNSEIPQITISTIGQIFLPPTGRAVRHDDVEFVAGLTPPPPCNLAP